MRCFTVEPSISVIVPQRFFISGSSSAVPPPEWIFVRLSTALPSIIAPIWGRNLMNLSRTPVWLKRLWLTDIMPTSTGRSMLSRFTPRVMLCISEVSVSRALISALRYSKPLPL